MCIILTPLDTGSIHASTVLYKSKLHLHISHVRHDNCSAVELLETVLFANIRFHDTVSRGRLLNRFGKDFEGHISSIIPHSKYLTSDQVSIVAFQITLVVPQSAFSLSSQHSSVSVLLVVPNSSCSSSSPACCTGMVSASQPHRH